MSQSQKEAAEYAEVLMAYSRGERIEMRCCEGITWSDLTYPLWDFGKYEYRVAPKPFEGWAMKNSSGTVMRLLFNTEKECRDSYGCSTGAPVLMREVTE